MSRIVLEAEERAQVAALADEVLSGVEVWDPLQLVDDVTGLAERLPLRLREFLVHSRISESDITVISGLPVDEELVPTPIGWDLAAKTGAGQREELVLLLCGAVLGDPFGWATQQDGRVVHDVCPAPGMEKSLTSASSEVALSLHTEDVHHPCRGDYVSLFCLRNPDAVGTTFVRIGALDLPPDTRRTLAEQRFRFYPDDSHVGAVLNALDGNEPADARVTDREYDPARPSSARPNARTCASTWTSCPAPTTTPSTPSAPRWTASPGPWSGSCWPRGTRCSWTTTASCTAGNRSCPATTARTGGSSGST